MIPSPGADCGDVGNSTAGGMEEDLFMARDVCEYFIVCVCMGVGVGVGYGNGGILFMLVKWWLYQTGDGIENTGF